MLRLRSTPFAGFGQRNTCGNPVCGMFFWVSFYPFPPRKDDCFLIFSCQIGGIRRRAMRLFSILTIIGYDFFPIYSPVNHSRLSPAIFAKRRSSRPNIMTPMKLINIQLALAFLANH